MAIGRKGFFFTAAAIVLVIVLVLYATSGRTTRMREKALAIEQRVKTMDHIVTDIEKDIQRGGYIASFRALLALQQYLVARGGYINNTQGILQELIVNGTIDGNYISVMNGTELNVWIQRISHEAGKTGIQMNCTIEQAVLMHSDPWTLILVLDTRLNLRDDSNLAYWTRHQQINSTLSIIGFEDPLYSVNTLGRVINTIEKSPFTEFVVNDDPANLKSHVERGYYIESASAPSFLMRISGDFRNSSMGIESIVNLLELEANDIAPMNKSCIDHVYFSSNNPPSFLINRTYNWLRLDEQSGAIARYQVENLTIR